MSNSPIQHVSDTAFWVATFRAHETERPDALFRDPLAKVLVGEDGDRIAAQMDRSKIVGWSVVIRTHMIDGFIREAIAQGVDTIINLGAGLDTRPYRMELPKDLRWVEVDYPGIIEHKESRLKNESPRCRLERIRMDLADREARRKMLSDLHSNSKKVLVLTEGVLPYLSNDSVKELADDLSQFEKFEYWIVEYWTKTFVERMRDPKHLKQMEKAPFLFNPDNWDEFFKSSGWKADTIKYHGIESYFLKRRAPIPFFARLMFLFMPLEKRMKFAKMSGYALMRPAK